MSDRYDAIMMAIRLGCVVADLYDERLELVGQCLLVATGDGPVGTWVAPFVCSVAGIHVRVPHLIDERIKFSGGTKHLLTGDTLRVTPDFV